VCAVCYSVLQCVIVSGIDCFGDLGAEVWESVAVCVQFVVVCCSV